jgi:hypothetical protein
VRVSRKYRSSVLGLPRICAQKTETVPKGTPASVFVASCVASRSVASFVSRLRPVSRPSSVSRLRSISRPSPVSRQRSVECHQTTLSRSVPLRPLALAYGKSPRSALKRALETCRQAARRKTYLRLSERFAGQNSRPGVSKSVVGQSVKVRFVVASESKGWRSLSEVLDQVLISVGREDDIVQAPVKDEPASVN